ncbi:hypothetical protein Nepgr_016427 [Nepenthes gracilis]|uniref:Uncharacterized protein n=1 Tax=Nepenthes gracilis TaxID=150966 RepID=A0AAD3SQH2_NEPGR|nr:hypothetical protein Nepgr_016427 [Nepenthes gracilis]
MVMQTSRAKAKSSHKHHGKPMINCSSHPLLEVNFSALMHLKRSKIEQAVAQLNSTNRNSSSQCKPQGRSSLNRCNSRLQHITGSRASGVHSSQFYPKSRRPGRRNHGQDPTTRANFSTQFSRATNPRPRKKQPPFQLYRQSYLA